MSAARSPEVGAAYLHCRHIAKREAKNFYYAFRVLPKHKSDAMCAVYAFMRHADDLADDERYSIEQRRAMMATWTEAWRSSREGASADPVFIALLDTQRCFGIPDTLLEELVAGTTLDLYDGQPGIEDVVTLRSGGEELTVQAYRSFDDLYRYCYLVASVVGLVCIRIFGYTNPKAEEHAEKVGIAFQLTNILRDVVEDAERRRVYLPLDDLEKKDSSLDILLADVRSKFPSAVTLATLKIEIERAEGYYQSVKELIPLLDRDSRAAMNVLAKIYHELLYKIAEDPAAIFRGRVSVATSRKLAILLKGLFFSRFTRSGT